jgi:hypothetical protein
MEMMPPLNSRRGVPVAARCWKNPLPRPFSIGIRILSDQRPWEYDSAGANTQVQFMSALDLIQMSSKIFLNRFWEYGSAVLSTFSIPNENFSADKVDVLNA